jgi:hypothetical protein
MSIDKIGSVEGAHPSDPSEPRRNPLHSPARAANSDAARIAPRDVVALSSHAAARVEREKEKYIAMLRGRADVRARRVKEMREKLATGAMLDPETIRRVAQAVLRMDEEPADEELREL